MYIIQVSYHLTLGTPLILNLITRSTILIVHIIKIPTASRFSN